MKLVIGIDGGGTKTRASLFALGRKDTLPAKPLATAECGPCNIAFMPLDETAANALNAIADLGADIRDVRAVCAAVAGYSFAGRRAPFLERLQAKLPYAKLTLVPDYCAAFAGALPHAAGILVIAGTGSVACGSNGARARRAGGYGYLIDDRGSGYGIGRSSVAAVLSAMDGTGPSTTLSQRVSDRLKIASGDWDAFIEAVYSGRVTRVTIASLAEVVSVAATEDCDEVARRILMKAGGSLAILAESVHRSVWPALEDIETGPASIARVGSLWKAGSSLTSVFERSCRRFAPTAKFVEPASDPVYGAALIARRVCDGQALLTFDFAGAV